MPIQRFVHIDRIRTIAIAGIILTHVLALHLGPTHINIIWNYLHFTVVGLVFCSAYLYAARSPTEDKPVLSVTKIKKRFLRLYMPFVIYLMMHYLLWFLFPAIIHGFGLKKSLDFIIASITLTGGIDIGWLPLLFIQLACISPLFLYVARKRRLNLIFLIALISLTATGTFYRIPTAYSRLTAWIPWSLIVLLAYNYHDAEYKNPSGVKKILINVIITGVVIWSALLVTLNTFNQTLTLTLHKYPPDLFYFTYGIIITSLMLLSFPRHTTASSYGSGIIGFISRHSYVIFFAHYILLDMITKAS